MPFALKKRVDSIVQEMITQDVIQPSQSPWTSAVILVKKGDRMWFHADYCQLNQGTKCNVFPFPCINNTVDLLSGAENFITFALASGYC